MTPQRTTTITQLTLPTKVVVGAFLLGLLALVTWVYHLVVTFEFVNLDDHLLIFQDYSVRHFDWQRAFVAPSAGLYHPLTTLTFLLENRFIGLDPSFFHANNLALHLINILLVYFLAHSLALESKKSFWLVTFFALHPLAVESVAWVAERKDVLSTLFFLLACLCYVQTPRKGWKITFWVLAIFFTLGALLAKPSTVVLPIVFLWIDRALGRDFTLRSVVEKMPFILVAIGTCVINWRVQTELRGFPAWPGTLNFILSPIRALVFYLSKAFVPLNLSISYPAGPNLIAAWQWLFAGCFCAAAIWAARNRQTRREIVLAATWFVVIIAPMLKIIPFGDLSPVNERFFYLAGLGIAHLSYLIVGELSETLLPSRLSAYVVTTIGVLFIAFCAYLTQDRVRIWRTTETLWQDVLIKNPNDGRAHANLARYYQSIGLINPSIQHFQKAIAFEGDKIAVLLADLAYLLIEQNRDQEAHDLLAQARRVDPTDPRVLNIEGVYLWRHGDITAAESKLRQALARPPGLSAAEQRAKIMNNLGLVLAAKGDSEGAINMYQNALDLQPESASTVYNQALVYLNSGKLDDAVTTFTKAIQIDPSLSEAWADLGVTYFVKGDLEKSGLYLRQALEKAPSHARARRNLSIIWAKLGHCGDAQRLLQQSRDSDLVEENWPQEVKSCVSH